MSYIGKCEHCDRHFSYRLIHNGFNDSAFAYCDTCGCVAILSMYSKRPKGIVFEYGMTIKPDIESYLAPCTCGGRFRADAAPRCPHCHQILSAEKAASYIEANAPGTAKGWKWQRSWNALYALIVEDRVVDDPWDPVKLEAKTE